MQKVNGIGGVFFRARDPKALRDWYAHHLGVWFDPEGTGTWAQEAGPTVVSQNSFPSMHHLLYSVKKR